MSITAVFAHLDSTLNDNSASIIPSTESPTQPLQFYSAGNVGRRGTLEAVGNHRWGEWRLLDMSHREVIGLRRQKASILCRLRIEVKGDEAQAEREADELGVAIVSWLANPTNGRGVASTTTIRAIAPNGQPTLSRVIPDGKTNAVALILAIPFDVLHGEC